MLSSISRTVPKKRKAVNKVVLVQSPKRRKEIEIESFTSLEDLSSTSQVFDYERGTGDSIPEEQSGPTIPCQTTTTPVLISLENNRKENGTYVRQKEHIYRIRRKFSEAQKEISYLKSKINQLRKENDEIRKQLIISQEILGQMPARQNLVVQQAVVQSKCKSPSGMRYSSEWVLDCIIFKIRSTGAYEFLRKNHYLPLPGPTTLYRYLKHFDAKFGFDDSVFNLLKEKLSSMTHQERRGILMFDEIKLTPQNELNKKTLLVMGKVDYGQFTRDMDKSVDGDHGLVFLFRPHLGQWIQVVGSFCAAGATPGKVLSQLLIHCIIRLSNSGVIVDAIVSDNVSTNDTATSQLGISGKKDGFCNKFVHPLDPEKKIYVLRDMPHLLKLIRNNLINSSYFIMPNGKFVKHNHYETLLKVENEIPCGLKVAFKLKEAHIHPNNFQKMNVRLAAQLFSNSTATALDFYKTTTTELSDCQETIDFTKKVNELFDSANARIPKDGIRKNSTKLDCLKKFLAYLEEWCKHIALQPADLRKKFLSRQTTEGLRLTLTSLIELTEELLNDGFKYVLTGTINQDQLERFFGMVRQMCGTDDHPTVVQFLYIYRLLTTYSLIKPPKKANVEAFSRDDILVKLKTLSIKDTTMPQQEKLEQELEIIFSSPEIVTPTVQCPANFPQDEGDLMLEPDTKNCILQYLGGYIIRRLRKDVACDICSQDFESDNQNRPQDRLINLKNQGGLIHPQEKIMNCIKLAEDHIQSACKHSTATLYYEIMNNILEDPNLPKTQIGCAAHTARLSSKLLHFYVVTRIHFFTRHVNGARKSKIATKSLRKKSRL